jgi:hypothetical protein
VRSVYSTSSRSTSTDLHYYNVELRAPHIFTVGVPQLPVTSSEFNATLASRVVWAKLFEVRLDADSFDPLLCEDDGGCKDTEFCGLDGTCHPFNCVNLYQYGPPTFTGHEYQDASAPVLVCSRDPPAVDASNPCLPDSDSETEALYYVNSTIESPWPLLIHRHCIRSETGSDGTDYIRDYPSRCAYDYLRGRYATLNRYCFARPNPYQNFSCYDMDPNTTDGMELYLADYVNKTSLNSECTVDNFATTTYFDTSGNATVQYVGSHEYSTCINGACWFVDRSVGYRELTPTDYERLRHVMHSRLIGDLPAATPSSSAALAAGPIHNVFLLGTATTIIIGSALTWMGWIGLD